MAIERRDPFVDLTSRQQGEYSIRAALEAGVARILGDGKRASCLATEVSDAIRDRYVASVGDAAGERGERGGILVPFTLSAARARAHNALQLNAAPFRHTRAGLDSSTATKGQELKFTEAGDFLEILRNQMAAYNAGVSYMTGLQGPVAFPIQTNAGTAAWYSAENPGSDLSPSNLLLSQISLAPKTLSSTTSFSRQLLRMSVVGVEAVIQADLAAILALEFDRAILNGSGASGQPTGILNTAGIGSIALGVNGLTPTFANLVDMETQVANANADQWPCSYIMHPMNRGTFRKAVPLGNAIATPVWQRVGAPPVTDQEQTYSRAEALVNGYPAFATANLPNNLVKGSSSNCMPILFGAFSQCITGDWGAFESIIDPYALKKQGMVEVTIFAMLGVAVKYPLAFCAIKDALP